MNPLRILLVDDHQLIRDGLKRFLDDSDEFSVIGEAANGQEALDLLRSLDADMVITDINMPIMDGLDLIRYGVSDFPKVSFIAVTMLEDPKAIKAVLKSGVKGYLLKNCSMPELTNAIRTVAGGGTYFSPDVTQKILESISGKPAKPVSKGRFDVEEGLTTREIEVLKLVLSQFSNQEIADKLFISPRTVDAHKRNILEKTGKKNTVGLVMYALEKGIVTEDWLQEVQLA